MFVGAMFTCVLKRLLPCQVTPVSCPLGRSWMISGKYCISRVSENHARPRLIGPDAPSRGDHEPMRSPLCSSNPGIKLVAVYRTLSSPILVSIATVPADPLPASGEPEEYAIDRT